jgi:2-methylcitrate dehydratase PrpD
VEAALLARGGLTGPHDAIEGAQGFVHAFSDTFDPAPLAALGTRYRMLDLTFKPHAGSARLQAAVEAACELVRDGLEPADIVSVEIGIPAVIEGRLTRNDPASVQEAQVSVPFAVAMGLALTAGRSWPPTLTMDDFVRGVDDPTARSIAQRTRCIVDPEIERATTTEYVPARVTVDLRDGSRVERKVMLPAGSPRRPMTYDEICTRFRELAAGELDSKAVGVWLTRARELEALPNVSELMGLRAALA